MMRQRMKHLLMMLCMAVCVLTLAACGSRTSKEEPVPERIELGMKSGAENYVRQFDRYDDAALESDLKRMRKQKNTVMESALLAWKTDRKDLGAMISVLSEEVVRVDEDSYQVTLIAAFEKRNLEFILTAEEMADTSYSSGTSLVPTGLTFHPVYTIGEKLTRAFFNMLLGMGTVFCVLLFMSFVISRLPLVNTLAEKLRPKKETGHPEE